MHTGFAHGVAGKLRRLRRRADVDQQLFLAVDEVRGIEGRDLEAVSVRDGVGGAGLDAVSAEDAAVVIDVVDGGVALGAGDAALSSVLRGLDVNAIRWTGRGAEEAGDALLQSVLVALEHVHAAEALLEDGALERSFAIRIVLHDRRGEHLPEGDGHSLRDG